MRRRDFFKTLGLVLIAATTSKAVAKRNPLTETVLWDYMEERAPKKNYYHATIIPAPRQENQPACFKHGWHPMNSCPCYGSTFPDDVEVRHRCAGEDSV